MAGQIFNSTDNRITGLRNRELSSIRKIYDNYAYSLSGIIALATPDKETRNYILEKTFIEVWNEADSSNAKNDSIFVWLLRMTIKVIAQHLNVPLIEIQKLVFSTYKEIQAKGQK
jgi:hypothetical protein